MRQTGKEYGHRDMCLYFAFQGRSQFYYTHLATTPDPNAHNVFIVDNAPRKSFLEVPKKGVHWGEDWKHIRLERQGDRIRVYFEDMKQPVLEGRHSALASGAIGFGSLTMLEDGQPKAMGAQGRDAIDYLFSVTEACSTRLSHQLSLIAAEASVFRRRRLSTAKTRLFIRT